MATWSFVRHADVLQALVDPQLLPLGQARADTDAHLAVRNALAQALRPERLTDWRRRLSALAFERVDALPAGRPVDLVAGFAQPWSIEVAWRVTAAPQAQAATALALAGRVFDAAAHSADGAIDAAAQQAAVELSSLLNTPAAQAQVADVQSFVALTHSLPALLAGAWQALLDNAPALATLQAQPQALAQAVDELLRLGSPSRVVFRQAAASTVVGGQAIAPGDRVSLHLHAANRDPARFAEPDRLQASHPAAGQLGLGAGPHHCAGAALVRMALIVATEALLPRLSPDRGNNTALNKAPDLGGFAISSPAALWTVLNKRLV